MQKIWPVDPGNDSTTWIKNDERRNSKANDYLTKQVYLEYMSKNLVRLITAQMLCVLLLSSDPVLADDALVERGRLLFIQETFEGNGRTCATCHRPDNNYTIDPLYISGLAPADPLFVAETNANLAGLERPQLLRQLGLIAVHADGYGKPAVFRAVPSLSGLRHSIRPSADLGRSVALGASADGVSPLGSLRDFIVGAVVDHLPRTEARVLDIDYRIPTVDELSAIEAFLFSLGPPVEFDIARMTFTSPEVENGRLLFLSERSGPCADCHANAGSLDSSGVNGLFDIGIQHRVASPAHLIDPSMPGDAGFGSDTISVIVGGRVGFGDGRFSPPSLVEAADTTPLFHDHSALTLEAAIHFYVSPHFVNSPEGSARTARDMDAAEIRAIASFLRTINTLENIRSARVFLAKVRSADIGSGFELAHLAAADTEDAFRALYAASGIYPSSIRLLLAALTLQKQSIAAFSVEARNALVDLAEEKLDQAGSLIVR